MMNDDMQNWSRLWCSQEVDVAAMMRRAQTAHRKEAALKALAVAGVAFVALATLRGVVNGVLDLGDSVGRLRASFALFTVLTGVWAVWKWQQQVVEARAQLGASPSSMVGDLKRVRERELYWWVSKPALGVTLVLCLLALGLGISRMIPSLLVAELGEEPSSWPLVYVVVALTSIAVIGWRRVVTLRRELQRLTDLERELSQ